MEQETISTWKAKDREVPINEMSNTHLQKAYRFAEYRYMKHENDLVKLSDKVYLFETLLTTIEEEAKKRGMELKSLTDKTKEKFDILRNRKRVKVID